MMAPSDQTIPSTGIPVQGQSITMHPSGMPMPLPGMPMPHPGMPMPHPGMSMPPLGMSMSMAPGGMPMPLTGMSMSMDPGAMHMLPPGGIVVPNGPPRLSKVITTYPPGYVPDDLKDL